MFVTAWRYHHHQMIILQLVLPQVPYTFKRSKYTECGPTQCFEIDYSPAFPSNKIPNDKQANYAENNEQVSKYRTLVHTRMSGLTKKIGKLYKIEFAHEFHQTAAKH